jgi:hypothetical protein
MIEGGLEKENQHLNSLQTMEKKLITVESNFIKSEIENQKLTNELDMLNDWKEKAGQDKVSLKLRLSFI